MRLKPINNANMGNELHSFEKKKKNSKCIENQIEKIKKNIKYKEV